MATWALVCGILGLVCCPLLAPVAIVLGARARGEGSTGGLATIAIVLGIIGCLMLVGQLVFIIVPMTVMGGL